MGKRTVFNRFRAICGSVVAAALVAAATVEHDALDPAGLPEL
jgi:hypothetical protein